MSGILEQVELFHYNIGRCSNIYYNKTDILVSNLSY